MADLRIDYQTIEELISCFQYAKNAFEQYGSTQSPQPGSDDPVAHHHSDVLSGQEANLLSSSHDSFVNAQDDAQAAYDAFKLADVASGGNN